MGKRTTLKGYQRQGGNPLSDKNVLGVAQLMTQEFSFDPTAASAGVGVFLPKGAVPMAVLPVDAGATGGTNPTVDIGIEGDPDGLADEMDADAGSGTGLVMTGAALHIPLTKDTEIVAGVGASAATGGTVKARVLYYMDDDGKKND